jgi:hypothetical protein
MLANSSTLHDSALREVMGCAEVGGQPARGGEVSAGLVGGNLSPIVEIDPPVASVAEMMAGRS